MPPSRSAWWWPKSIPGPARRRAPLQRSVRPRRHPARRRPPRLHPPPHRTRLRPRDRARQPRPPRRRRPRQRRRPPRRPPAQWSLRAPRRRDGERCDRGVNGTPHHGAILPCPGHDGHRRRDGSIAAIEAEGILRTETEAIDRACSRFRPDSELAHLHANAGRTVEVSSLLFESLDVAYSVAERTHGAVDPTVGNAIEKLGYDRDFEQIEPRPLQLADPGPVPGFRHLHLDRRRRAVRIPVGVHLDLGSSAKALLADRAAAHVSSALGSGALVSIGGDVAAAGAPPTEGWAVGIAVDSSADADEVDQVVAIRGGGLASSSAEIRAWQMGSAPVHHIVDPATGGSSSRFWRLVSAAGPSCVDANALSTAAMVWGEEALVHLRQYDQAVRLLRHDGVVFALGGWPEAEHS